MGEKKVVFGTVLPLGEKQWVLDEINSILRGDIPQLQSVVLAEGRFEFVPNEVAPEVANRNIRVDRSDADALVFEAVAKPRSRLGQAAWMLELVLRRSPARCCSPTLSCARGPAVPASSQSV